MWHWISPRHTIHLDPIDVYSHTHIHCHSHSKTYNARYPWHYNIVVVFFCLLPGNALVYEFRVHQFILNRLMKWYITLSLLNQRGSPILRCWFVYAGYTFLTPLLFIVKNVVTLLEQAKLFLFHLGFFVWGGKNSLESLTTPTFVGTLYWLSKPSILS